MVMIPAYNEEGTVGKVVKSTLALYPDFKVVVIDDGSEDRTAKRAEEAGADVVSLPFHCGGSIAVQTGYLIAAKNGYDYLVKIDADGQHKPDEIPKMLGPLTDNAADITVGSRYIAPETNEGSVVREGGRVFSSTIVSMFPNIGVTDVTSGMRAWNRRAIEILLSEYMDRGLIDDSVFWIAETLVASRKGLCLTEVPIKTLDRERGESKSFSFGKKLLYPVRLLLAFVEEIRGPR